ncbi:helix-turn-helix transcriptional regulator [Compostibacter hankyongensis]|uniref:HTH cro/C1-type domain-containing protein n=1 Tax=Compostibacter hankyongensis TaxID=1007089 RepID=A0ABP8G4A8_9BACT
MVWEQRYNEEIQLFGERIRWIRKSLGLKQEDLKALCGISRTEVSRIEHGKNNVELLTLTRLGMAFKAELHTFFAAEDAAVVPVKQKRSMPKRLAFEKKALGLRLYEVRKHRKLSQLDLNVLTDIDSGEISRYESGQINIVFSTLVRFATALEIPLADLFDYDGPLPDNTHYKGMKPD